MVLAWEGWGRTADLSSLTPLFIPLAFATPVLTPPNLKRPDLSQGIGNVTECQGLHRTCSLSLVGLPKEAPGSELPFNN